MIAQITGTVLAIGGTWILVDLSGFGLRAQTTPATAASARIGQSLTLHTSLIVREDSLTLFAFVDADERDAFELVQSASGIGPKIALATVSVLPPDQLRAAVSSQNLVALMKVPGIGRKGAERLVIELRDKVAGLGGGGSESGTSASAPGASDWRESVAAGLESLGWNTKDATAAVERVQPMADADPSLGVAGLLRAALRTLAKN